MVRIGITYNAAIDLFMSGSAQTSVLLVELFKKVGYDVTLINTKISDNNWWPNFPYFENVTLSQLHTIANLDILIDIDGYVNPSYRKKIAKKTIVFMRTFLQFNEMDLATFAETREYIPRSFENVSEIWCWDILNPAAAVPAVQTLFPCPIRRVPFIWSPLITDHFSRDLVIKHNNECNDWTVHIAEKNNVNSSSSVFALVAVRELYLKNVIDAKYKCHNIESLLEHRFLKENILNNIKVDTMPVKFVKKEAFYEFAENSILFSHTRFLPLRIGLLNAVWMGLPCVHNSPILKNIHPELGKMFYFGNEITSICSVFKDFSSNPSGFYGGLPEIREAIIKNWGISSNLDTWRIICSDVFGNMSHDAIPLTKKVININKPFIVAFLQMWDGFNFNSNFIVDALRMEEKECVIQGVKYEVGVDVNIVIFGPFSKGWEDIPSHIPKVFFTGENWEVPKDDSIRLYITPYRNEDEKHIRLPTWMMSIDWYSNATNLSSVNKDDNPNRLPVKMAMTPHSKSFNDRTDFCGFVVSNPISKFRNEAFLALDSYKRVNSGGGLYNNIGGRLELKYDGGGAGDIPKYNFLSNHKFSLSFENSQAAGYITEKVLHAKMAGCVPLYWGDADTDIDFVAGSIINLSQLTSPEQIVKVVQKLEQHPEMCAKIAATPILNEEKKSAALATISRMAKKILELASVVSEATIEDTIEDTIKLENIKKTFIVNLDTRLDRWQSLMKAEPYLENSTRIAAVNGRSLKLNKSIYNIFKNNRFSWKKSVMGCFLSHFDIWTKIVNDRSGDNELYLVLEDDVRFDKGWIDTWNKCVREIPKDAELLYLGGVLPPNKAALPLCLEQVNQYWSQIKLNTLFSPAQPLPIFHFCTYSYVITKAGAKKLLTFLGNGGDYQITECDHFLGNHIIGLKKYILTPLITHCFQDEDETYITSEFNNVNITKTFDSDICNNTECFTDSDIEPFLGTNEEVVQNKQLELYYFNNNKPYELYEIAWTKEIFSKDINLKPMTSFLELVPNNSWFIVQRPHLEAFNKYFAYLLSENINFKVLHLSDEFMCDDLRFYTYANCKGVIRNYIRPDMAISLPHIQIVPLGFHYKGNNTKTFDERSLVWSFHGTAWFNRKEILEKLQVLVPNNCHFTNFWNDPKMTNESKYLNALANSKFCPILRGNNIETFRLYETLETGTIPVYVRVENDIDFWNKISRKLELISIDTWEKAVAFINFLLEKPDYAEKYRLKLVENWRLWKNEIRMMCNNLDAAV